jgi:hypothetical protein
MIGKAENDTGDSVLVDDRLERTGAALEARWHLLLRTSASAAVLQLPTFRRRSLYCAQGLNAQQLAMTGARRAVGTASSRHAERCAALAVRVATDGLFLGLAPSRVGAQPGPILLFDALDATGTAA